MERGEMSRTNIPMEFSIAQASSMFPGFRFSPTDEELIQFYLKRKLQGCQEGVEVIPEVDICRHEPWELPGEAVIHSDCEWFFFTPRGRKYPNGSQSRRATPCGFWKATGKERCVKTGSAPIGTKRTLVFHMGRSPNAHRTEWIMQEYSMHEKSEDAIVICRLRRNRDFQHLDDPTRALREQGVLAVDNSTQSCVEQSGLLNVVKTTASCSKDCGSSHNSRSVEQVGIGTGFASDENITNEYSQHASNINEVFAVDPVEECYADIMKDDIIKLDDSSLNEKPKPSWLAAEAAFPFQGPANRRLRLRKHRMESLGEEVGYLNFEKRDFSAPDAGGSGTQPCIIDKLYDRRRVVAGFLGAVIIILVLLLLLTRGYKR